MRHELVDSTLGLVSLSLHVLDKGAMPVGSSHLTFFESQFWSPFWYAVRLVHIFVLPKGLLDVLRAFMVFWLSLSDSFQRLFVSLPVPLPMVVGPRCGGWLCSCGCLACDVALGRFFTGQHPLNVLCSGDFSGPSSLLVSPRGATNGLLGGLRFEASWPSAFCLSGPYNTCCPCLRCYAFGLLGCR